MVRVCMPQVIATSAVCTSRLQILTCLTVYSSTPRWLPLADLQVRRVSLSASQKKWIFGLPCLPCFNSSVPCNAHPCCLFQNLLKSISLASSDGRQAAHRQSVRTQNYQERWRCDGSADWLSVRPGLKQCDCWLPCVMTNVWSCRSAGEHCL